MFQNYGDEDCKSEILLISDGFNYILDTIHDQIVLTPANLKPNLTPPHRQLGLTIYQLGMGCSCNTLAAFFDLSVGCVEDFLNKTCRILVSKPYDQYVCLPETEAEWEPKLRGL